MNESGWKKLKKKKNWNTQNNEHTIEIVPNMQRDDDKMMYT